MIDIEEFRNLALSFPETAESPHFEKKAFRTKVRIFATLDTTLNKACVKLTAIDQSIFCAIDPSVIYRVNNKWGKQGWTFIELKKVRKSILKDALSKAYITAAPKKITGKK